MDVQKLHRHYGDVVRTAPDEVSFACEDAWHDIYQARTGRKQFPKDPVFFQSPPGQPPNLITVIDMNESARMRQLIMPAFTDRALMKQEPTIQSYASLMMSRLRELVASPEDEREGAIINVVDWYNWFTFDVAGDLSLGEAFGCLRDTKNHPWVSLIFNALKGMNSSLYTKHKDHRGSSFDDGRSSQSWYLQPQLDITLAWSMYSSN